MTAQEIFIMLAENESKLFYAKMQNKDNQHIADAHAAAKKALEEYAATTGCHN